MSLIHFPLDDSQEFIYNVNTDSWRNVFHTIRTTNKVNFKLKTDTTISYGPGTNRHVAFMIMNQLLSTGILYRVGLYYVKPNLENQFWDHEDNIETFIKFIKFCMDYETKLIYHLHPVVLETIVGFKCNKSELLMLLQISNPCLFQEINKLSEDEFENIVLYSQDEYLRMQVIGESSLEEQMVYNLMSKYFRKHDFVSRTDIISLDDALSGYYTLTTDTILTQMIFNGSTKYENDFHSLIRSFNSNELKSFVITITGSYHFHSPIRVYVIDTTDIDIRISTCSCTISINQTVFDMNLLALLKENLIGVKSNDIVDEYFDRNQPVRRESIYYPYLPLMISRRFQLLLSEQRQHLLSATPIPSPPLISDYLLSSVSRINLSPPWVSVPALQMVGRARRYPIFPHMLDDQYVAIQSISNESFIPRSPSMIPLLRLIMERERIKTNGTKFKVIE